MSFLILLFIIFGLIILLIPLLLITETLRTAGNIFASLSWQMHLVFWGSLLLLFIIFYLLYKDSVKKRKLHRLTSVSGKDYLEVYRKKLRIIGEREEVEVSYDNLHSVKCVSSAIEIVTKDDTLNFEFPSDRSDLANKIVATINRLAF